MVLKTFEMLGPLHGYGIARRIEQTLGDKIILNCSTRYPALVKLEQEGAIASAWGCRTTIAKPSSIGSPGRDGS